MSSSLNKVTLIGRLVKTPELKTLPNDKMVVNVSLATSDTYKSKTGEKKEHTDYHNLTFWNKQAEVAAKYLKKGDQIYIEGSIRSRKYESSTGETKYTTEIHVNELKMLSQASANKTEKEPAHA